MEIREHYQMAVLRKSGAVWFGAIVAGHQAAVVALIARVKVTNAEHGRRSKGRRLSIGWRQDAEDGHRRAESRRRAVSGHSLHSRWRLASG